MFRTPRRLAALAVGLWALSLPLWPSGAAARDRGEPTSDPAVVPASVPLPRRPLDFAPRRGANGASKAEAAATWWLGPVGVAGAFAVVGGISLAARRFGWNLNLGGLARDVGPIGVIGQTRLTPKHSVYLVRVGGRVLILGAGAGGSPTTLGEVTDPLELARLAPGRAGGPAAARLRPADAPRPRSATGFDRRIGDDE